MPRRTKKYKDHLLERLQTTEDVVAYLNAALEEEEMSVFLRALRDVADAQGVGKVAADASLNREHFYRMLSAQGNPTLSSLRAILHVLGIDLRIESTTARKVEAQVTVTVATKLLGGKADPEHFVPAHNEGTDYESTEHTNDESLAA